MDIEALRASIEALDVELRALHQDENGELRSLTDDEQTAFDAKFAEREKQVKLLARHEAVAAAGQIPERVESPQVIRKTNPYEVLEDRSATSVQLADAATRALETHVEDPDKLSHARTILKRHRSDRDWTRNMIARTHDDYTSGWLKYATGREMLLTNEERAALAVGTNTQGGFLVPTHLDPSIIFTNTGTSNVIRSLSRVVSLTTGNVWNGVTSAGSTFSVDAELAEVSDDTPSVARVSVPVYKAQGFVQADIEAFEDIDALSSDVLMIFADGKDRLEGQLHATGSGSGPTGIVTALDANTNSEIVATTAATFSLADLQKVYRALGVRWRGRSAWLLNPLYMGSIQALGTALSANYSSNLADPYSDRVLGKPVVESDDMPNTVTTTANDNQLVFGDFGTGFLIVDKPGSTSLEFIPHLFNTGNNLPDGRRGWYMHWRTGSDSIVDAAFRLYQSKTSA